MYTLFKERRYQEAGLLYAIELSFTERAAVTAGMPSVAAMAREKLEKFFLAQNVTQMGNIEDEVERLVRVVNDRITAPGTAYMGPRNELFDTLREQAHKYEQQL